MDEKKKGGFTGAYFTPKKVELITTIYRPFKNFSWETMHQLTLPSIHQNLNLGPNPNGSLSCDRAMKNSDYFRGP